MDESNFETSDILSFDYTVDDEFRDEQEEETSNLDGSKPKKNQNGVETDCNEEKISNNEKCSKAKSKNSITEKKDQSSKSKSTPVMNSTNNCNKELKMDNSKEADKGMSSSSSSSSFKLFVSGITEELKATDLQKLFLKYGNVAHAKIIRFSKIPNECFGLVTMENDQQAKKCIQNLNKTKLLGNTITISKQSPLKSLNESSNNHLKVNEDSKNTETKDSKALKEKKRSNNTSSSGSKQKSNSEKNSKSSKDKNADSKNENTKTDKSTKGSNDSKKKETSSSTKDKDRNSSRKRSRDRDRTRSRSRSRSRSRNRSSGNRPIPLSRNFIRRQERLARLRERREREELDKIRQERIRFQREKERLQLERLQLEKEKIEFLRLEREKIIKERDEVARRRHAAEEQRKRSDYLPPKKFGHNSRSRSPDIYRSKRSNSGSYVETPRFESRESRSYKRSKYDSSIDYDSRRNSLNSHDRDRDDRKDMRRDSRERRFEDLGRERFSEKDTAAILSTHSPRTFPVNELSRQNWTNTVGSSPWTASGERWVPNFDPPHQVTINSSIVPNNVNALNEVYSNYNLPLSGINTSSYSSLHTRRF